MREREREELKFVHFLTELQAYRLGGGGYGKEAETKLLSMLTEPEYEKTVVILAGYEKEMHHMLQGLCFGGARS